MKILQLLLWAWFFFPFSFCVMGSSNIRTKHTYMHTYICILQRYNKSICDRLSQEPHLSISSGLSFEHFLQHVNYTKSKENAVKVKHRVQILTSALLIVNEGRKQTWKLIWISFISRLSHPAHPKLFSPPVDLFFSPPFFSTVSH